MSDRFTNDRRFEADRKFAAYLRDKGLSETEVFHMKEEDIKVLRQEALNSGIEIPLTDRDYLYHGTSMRSAKRIREDGLLRDQKSGWEGDGFALHAKNRVFFCDTIAKALFYAREASREAPAILRVKIADLPDLQEDLRDTDGSFYAEADIAPSVIEIWDGGWSPIKPSLEDGPQI